MAKEMKMDVEMDCGINGVSNVLKLLNKKMIKDENWFLVDKKWFDACKHYFEEREDVNNPGPIDNSALFKSSETGCFDLKKNLQEEKDYQFLPEEAWNILINHFGVIDEKHVIKRKVIPQARFSNYCIVEVYPFELKLCLYGTKEESITQQYSRMTKLKQLENDMRQLFKIDDNRETQLWGSNSLLISHDSNSSFKDNGEQTLQESSLISGSVVTIELQNADGSWPSSRPRFGTISTRSSKSTPGLCGLMNMGNTCFMNSALQCMSNTTPLTEYFLSDKYWNELNVINPLGMGGEIAKSFAELIKAMWSGNSSCLAPREFKLAVGRFAPQFSGFQQQDCQELMAFLLDGLHEDLNRVKQKPYIAVKEETEKRPDAIVAAESWSNYKKRNDSIIVDTFHGLLKSTLVCPECELVSVTFDPYCYLSLPLPVKRERPIDVTFVPALSLHGNEKKCIRLAQINRLMIPKFGVILDVCNALAKVINDSKDLNGHTIEPTKLIVTEVFNHRFSKIYNNDDTYTIQLDEVYVFEKLDDKISIPVYLREVKSDETPVLFGRPFIVNIKDQRYETLYETIKQYIKQHFNPRLDEEESDADEGVECEKNNVSFNLTMTNSFGSMEISKLDKNKPLVINSKCFIAADFQSRFRNQYNEDSDSIIRITIHKNMNAGGKGCINLCDCIEQFTTTERLGEDDLWYCPRCKKQQQATKKFDLWSLPKVSIIHLKRFSYSRYWRDKLDTLVHFPINNFEMGQFLINNSKNEKIFYDLIAVANHYGGLGGGHYTAYAKNQETGHWHYFDDSNVSIAPEENVISKAAYVLFYLRKD